MLRKTATSELANPKIGREEARRLCLTSSPADMEGVEPSYHRYSTLQQSGGIFPESCPLILFRIIGWGIDPGADGRPFVGINPTFS